MSDKNRTLSAPRDLLERALASINGIRVWFPTQEAAISMRNRMATVKTESRKQSRKTYDFDNPLYNTSPYDGVATHIMPVEVFSPGFEPKAGQPTVGYWLYINPEVAASAGMYVEEL